MTSKELLRKAIQQLQQAHIESARIDAEILLMHCWQKSRTDLIIHADATIPEHVIEHIELLITRRCQYEPIAYLTGFKEFWSLPFRVSPDVLIPRPETEHLIEQVLQRFPDKNFPWLFCDIGTGSGCIAITLAKEYPNSHIVATDISDKALAIAKINAIAHQVDERISFQQGDLFAALGNDICRFHAIVSNPPYVSQQAMQDIAKDLHFEPAQALTDNDDGLTIIRKLIAQSIRWLQPNAYLMIETGLCGLPESFSPFNSLQTYQDLAGNLRGGIYSMKSHV